MIVIVHSTQGLASVQIDVVVQFFISCPVTFLIKVLWRSY